MVTPLGSVPKKFSIPAGNSSGGPWRRAVTKLYVQQKLGSTSGSPEGAGEQRPGIDEGGTICN